MFSTRIQIYNILYLDSPHFPRSWTAIVLFTVALTEAHLGAVQIQSCANLLIPFLSFFHPLHLPLVLSLALHSFLCTSVPVDGDVKYLNALCCLGTMQMGHRRTDPNVCKSLYKAAQDVFNITQVPQALF